MNHKIGDIVIFRYADEKLTGELVNIFQTAPPLFIKTEYKMYCVNNDAIIETQTRRYNMPDADLKKIIKESEKEKNKLMKDMELIRKKIQSFDESIIKANIEIELRRQEKVKNNTGKV
jgi:hypothetical protein